MKRILICVWVLGCIASDVSGAEPPMTTDRPDQSDSPFLVPSGLFQIEGGGLYGSRDADGEQLELQSFPSALLRFGVTDSFELRLGVPGVVVQREDSTSGEVRDQGLVDATLGFKFKLVEQKGAVPQTAFVGTLIIPSGDEEFSSDRVDPGFRFAFSNSITPVVSLTYNVGMFWLSERTDQNLIDTRSFLDWSVTAGFSATTKLAAFAEFFGVSGVSADDRSWASGGAGVTYLVTPRLQVDGRITIGLNRAALDWTAGVGASYRFPRSKG